MRVSMMCNSFPNIASCIGSEIYVRLEIDSQIQAKGPGADLRLQSVVSLFLTFCQELKNIKSALSNDLIVYQIPHKINKKSNTLTSDELTEEQRPKHELQTLQCTQYTWE